MTHAKMSPLRRRMVEDMRIRGLEATTQASYIRAIEAFAGFLGRSPDSATPAELRAWQLQLMVQIKNGKIEGRPFFAIGRWMRSRRTSVRRRANPSDFRNPMKSRSR